MAERKRSRARDIAAGTVAGVVAGGVGAAAYMHWRAQQGRREYVDGRPVELIKIDPRTLRVDADRFQFKAGGDTHGVTDRLKSVGRWDPLSSGKAIVWRDKQGRDYVADGHQRSGLARRLAEQGQNVNVDAYLMKEADGWTARDARIYAALKNIRESSGNALDMAKVMRERPELIDKSIPMSSSRVRDAVSLSKLSNDAFKMVVGGAVEPGHAAAVGEAVKDRARHADMLKEIVSAKIETARQAKLYVQQALAAPSIEDTQTSLFGAETSVRSLVKERAQVLDRAMTALRQDKRLFGLLEREASTITDAGNVLSRASNAERAASAGNQVELIEKLATTRGPVSDMLNKAAEAVAKGEAPSKAARSFASEVGKAIKAGGMGALTGAPKPVVAPIPEPPQAPQGPGLFDAPKKAATNPSAKPARTPRTAKSPSAGAKVAAGAAAGVGAILGPAAVAVTALAAANVARAEGRSQLAAAFTAGGRTLIENTAMAGGAGAMAWGLMKAGMSAPRASLVLTGGIMAGVAVKAALDAHREGASPVKAAVTAAWAASLPGAVVNTAVAGYDAAKERLAPTFQRTYHVGPKAGVTETVRKPAR